jgi:hypothetical protein
VTREQTRLTIVLLSLIGGALGAGCQYDEDKRCPAGYVYGDVLRACVCPPGAVAVDGGTCMSCGANEEAEGGVCKCKPGTTRNAQGVCELDATGAGADCAPGASSCANPAAPHCAAAPAGGGKGYCTSKGCKSHAECQAGWSCTTWEAEPYCRRPPTGLGKTCGAPADCAGLDASYCESFQAKTCMVSGCTVSPDNCGVGLACCDLSKLGLPITLCVPPGSCPQ